MLLDVRDTVSKKFNNLWQFDDDESFLNESMNKSNDSFGSEDRDIDDKIFFLCS